MQSGIGVHPWCCSTVLFVRSTDHPTMDVSCWSDDLLDVFVQVELNLWYEI
jgi:hypothetical protein